MREVTEQTTVKHVRRNGRTYEFGHTIESAFTTPVTDTYWPELHTLWARVHNGYGWTTLHYIVEEAE